MGCGSSTAANARSGYPRQPGHNYPTQRGQMRSQRIIAGNQGNDGQFAEGMLVGGAVGYMAGSQMYGGGGAGMMGGGMDLPGHFHLGPTLPQHDVTVAGMDVM